MSDPSSNPAPAATEGAPAAAPAAGASLDRAAYDVLRRRLSALGADLRARLGSLDDARRAVFGTVRTELIATERVATENNCVPRDIAPLGDDRFLFGYNVHVGLRSEVRLADVFAIYAWREGRFVAEPLDPVADPRFERDFKEIYKYYKDARFAKFSRLGPNFYMKFRTGPRPDDFKVFKWIVKGAALEYADNRSEHEFKYPAQHEFEWKRATRDLHRPGRHPHVSLDDRVFVETVGGDLTIKIENNTDSGEGILSEPVENKDQTLDDAEIQYALLDGLVLIRVRPYQEKAFRHFVYNERLKTAMRLDAVADACALLPADHGIVFSRGYYLQTGESKLFDTNLVDMVFERRVASPNGEDFLFVFYNRLDGVYLLLRYNLVDRAIEAPLVCHGFSIFEDGDLFCFSAGNEASKLHPVQIWRTPYASPDWTPPPPVEDGELDAEARARADFLRKIGNKELVRATSGMHEVLKLIERENPYEALYRDLAKLSGELADAFFWVGDARAFDLKSALLHIRGAAQSAIAEFDKVERIRRATSARTEEVAKRAEALFGRVKGRRFDAIDGFVEALHDLRVLRGDALALKDLRFADVPRADAIDKEAETATDEVAARCVEFLLTPGSLAPYEKRIEELAATAGGIAKAAEARAVEKDVTTTASRLEMLIEIVGNLKIDDATRRTAVVDAISIHFTRLNQVRASLRSRIRELAAVEGAAEFDSQLRLLSQGVVNALETCDEPRKCDEGLVRLMVQVQELEGRFAEFDDFVLTLTEKREEIQSAFEARRIQLVEARNRRAEGLAKAADRILEGARTRVAKMEKASEIHAWFASDLMIAKLREIVQQLVALEDSVRADSIQSRLKSVREDSIRRLRDRTEMFVEGQNVVRLGRHLFSVNPRPLELTTVPRDGELKLHLTGTNFFEPIRDERFMAARDLWDREFPSESPEVARAEYLAWLVLRELATEPGGLGRARDSAKGEEWPGAALLPRVQEFMAPRYGEGYMKGVHDQDAARLLRALIELRSSLGLLRFPTRARALASVFWRAFRGAAAGAHAGVGASADAARADGSGSNAEAVSVEARLRGFGEILRVFPRSPDATEHVADLRRRLDAFVAANGLFDAGLLDQAAEYLMLEVSAGPGFTIAREARDLYRAFQAHLLTRTATSIHAEAARRLEGDPVAAFRLHRDWLRAFLAERAESSEPMTGATSPGGASPGASTAADWARAHEPFLEEVASLLLHGGCDDARVIDAPISREVAELASDHPRVAGKRLVVDYPEFALRLERHRAVEVPRFEAFHAVKREVLDKARAELRLEEFKPRVLSSFVRNRLVNEVYLPLVGDNLAKQMGTVGENKRTDLMGMLLLISPPGYGKTTLLEYVASCLGLVFVKVNGPAIGHAVTSLDPTEAPNAGARQEIERLNLALEMGDNVLICVDDIQHCNPEFLQKFISLCDGQRKIEGVFRGRSRTYDLRGRKVVVVMAGNPYTESGDAFKIPDMLANRADTYNLGDILGDTRDVFELSFLENAVTSNPALARLAALNKDVLAIVRRAEGRTEGIDLEGGYGPEEIEEMVATMRKLIRARDVVLRANEEYIRSAAQADAYRVEPPFKLQGSYRNMNRIAEKIAAVMNDEELETLIHALYENDAQTLTTGAEANLLKFRELCGRITPEESARWEEIKARFKRDQALRGVGGDDKTAQALLQLKDIADGVGALRETVGAVGGAVGEKVGAAGEKLGASVNAVRASVGQVGEKIGAAGDKLGVGVAAVGERVGAAAAGVSEGLGALGGALGATTSGAMAPVAAKLDALAVPLRRLPEILDAARKAVEASQTATQTATASTEAAREKAAARLAESLGPGALAPVLQPMLQPMAAALEGIRQAMGALASRPVAAAPAGSAAAPLTASRPTTAPASSPATASARTTASAPAAVGGEIRAGFDEASLSALREVARALASAASRMVPGASPASPSGAATALPEMPAPAPAPPPVRDLPHTIEVVNRVPETLLRVLEHQCQLMQEWLEPTFRATEHQREEIRELREVIQKVMEHYDKLADAIAKALEKG